MTTLAWIIFMAAAILEVTGDASIRAGLRQHRWAAVLAGAFLLAIYGIVVNMVRWDFSKLLGVYIAFFALVSVSAGALYFRESMPNSTWIGLLLIVAGGLVIQFGRR